MGIAGLEPHQLAPSVGTTDTSSPQLATLLARQRSYTRSAEIIFVHMDASSSQLATLLARQRSYTRYAKIISVPTDALSILTDASDTMLSPDTLRVLVSSTHTFARRWQHARGLRLAWAFLHPGVGNTLGGCASNWHFFAPVLATYSGAAPYNPMLATLGGYTYMLTLAYTLSVPGVSNTLGGFALKRFDPCSGASP
jgi:hypothetical protein